MLVLTTFPVLIPAIITAGHAISPPDLPDRPAQPSTCPRRPAVSSPQPPDVCRQNPMDHPGLSGFLLQNRAAVPVTDQQREFDVEPVSPMALPISRPRRSTARPTRYFTELKCKLSSSAATL